MIGLPLKRPPPCPCIQVSLDPQLNLQGSPATVSLEVVTVQAVQLYIRSSAAPAPLTAAALPSPGLDGSYRAYKCDFSNYEQVRRQELGCLNGTLTDRLRILCPS